MDTGKSLRKTGISPSGEIPSCPHNALLEILSRNRARVVPDGFLRDLPVSIPALGLILFYSFLSIMVLEMLSRLLRVYYKIDIFTIINILI